jgi:hypothetical protein
MAKKKFNPDDLEEAVGPMNDVATADAMAYARADESRPLDKHKEREVRAKKQQIKKSTKKSERRMSKQIIQHVQSDSEH